MNNIAKVSPLFQDLDDDERIALLDKCKAKFGVTETQILELFDPVALERNRAIIGFICVNADAYQREILETLPDEICDYTAARRDESCDFRHDKCDCPLTALNRDHIVCFRQLYTKETEERSPCDGNTVTEDVATSRKLPFVREILSRPFVMHEFVFDEIYGSPGLVAAYIEMGYIPKWGDTAVRKTLDMEIFARFGYGDTMDIWASAMGIEELYEMFNSEDRPLRPIPRYHQYFGLTIDRHHSCLILMTKHNTDTMGMIINGLKVTDTNMFLTIDDLKHYFSVYKPSESVWPEKYRPMIEYLCGRYATDRLYNNEHV